jgi:hypothetical protein
MARNYRIAMGIERVIQLEQEFRVVKQLAANPVDFADYAQLKARLSAIAKEARQIIRAIHAPVPDWCKV